MSGQIQYGPVLPPTSLQTPPLGHEDRCHYTTPVRFGRRKTDQVGHLVLTSLWLTFRGTLDLNIAWTEVARVEQAGSELVVSLHGSRRTLRFCCPADEDAQRGAIVAMHLIALAQSEPLEQI